MLRIYPRSKAEYLDEMIVGINENRYSFRGNRFFPFSYFQYLIYSLSFELLVFYFPILRQPNISKE